MLSESGIWNIHACGPCSYICGNWSNCGNCPFLGHWMVSTAIRMILRKLKFKLQYLPRMAFILWAVVLGVLGVLFLAPVIKFQALSNVSIFAVLILVLWLRTLSVSAWQKHQNRHFLTMETLILAVISFFFLTFKPLQTYVLLNRNFTNFSWCNGHVTGKIFGTPVNGILQIQEAHSILIAYL